MRTQAELRRHLEHLLARRQAHTFGARSAREDANGTKTGLQRGRCRATWKAGGWSWNRSGSGSWNKSTAAAKSVKSLRAERDAIERQRAALLSARSIEHVQRELAAVQQKLEQATSGGLPVDSAAVVGEYPTRASDFLAQLTNGDLVRLVLVGTGPTSVRRESRGRDDRRGTP